jgi:hypothetical protein
MILLCIPTNLKVHLRLKFRFQILYIEVEYIQQQKALEKKIQLPKPMQLLLLTKRTDQVTPLMDFFADLQLKQDQLFDLKQFYQQC